jgi:peptidoglycan/LPS O-acetylase OafA/YrhL
MYIPTGKHFLPMGRYGFFVTMAVFLEKTATVMKTQNSFKHERQYYIDWLRIILILTVFLFHIGMVFNPFEWHIKNENQFAFLAPIMSFLHLWRMPLLFLISGAGTYYALGKRTTPQYLKERIHRLLIPLAAGIFLLVPVQVYYERIDQYASLLHYYPEMFQGTYPEGNFSWHHLWFIAYLFLISVITVPLLRSLKTGFFRRFRTTIEAIAHRKLGLNVVLIPLVLSQVLLKPYFPKETHDVVNDWAFIAFNAIFFISGFVLFTNRRIISSLKTQRRWYLSEALLATLFFFISRQLETMNGWPVEVLSIVVSWSCGVTAIAYAATYLNKDSRFRKPANEAIYPFYLLHQPAIVIWAYYITGWNTAAGWKALLIMALSFITSSGIYWLLIRPFNVTRLLFGMKRKPAAGRTKRTFKRRKPILKPGLQNKAATL